MTTLTDRYVWAVLRAVPQGKRADLEPEIRALVADAVDAHAGHASPDAAERAALVELGDPDALAAQYTDTTRFLIGPRLYPEWERLLLLLLPIVVPIAGIAFGAVGWAPASRSARRSWAASASRSTSPSSSPSGSRSCSRSPSGPGTQVAPIDGQPWTPDQLPELPAPDRLSLGEAVASVAFAVFVIVAIVWVQLATPIQIDGTAYPLFDPDDLDLVAVVRPRDHGRGDRVRHRALPARPLDLGVRDRERRSSPPRSRSRRCTSSQEDLLLNDELVAAVDAQAGGDWFSTTMAITVVVIVLVTVIDAVDGFRKAWRTSRQARQASAPA